jgi:hypothetical protein
MATVEWPLQWSGAANIPGWGWHINATAGLGQLVIDERDGTVTIGPKRFLRIGTTSFVATPSEAVVSRVKVLLSHGLAFTLRDGTEGYFFTDRLDALVEVLEGFGYNVDPGPERRARHLF